MTLDDVTDCVENAKTSRDRAARQLADDEHKRATLVLHRQREEILSSSSDAENEINEVKRTLAERELRLTAQRTRRPDTALSDTNRKHQTFLKCLHPTVMQPSAPALHADNPALKPAATQPSAPVPHAVNSASQLAAMQSPAPAPYAARPTLKTAATQPSASAEYFPALKPGAPQPILSSMPPPGVEYLALPNSFRPPRLMQTF